MLGMPPACTLGPMSAPPPDGPMRSMPSFVSSVPIACIRARAALPPLKPIDSGLNTPESASSIITCFARSFR